MLVVLKRDSPSKGCSALANTLLGMNIRSLRSSRTTWNKARLIINWGSLTETRAPRALRILNSASVVRVIRDKVLTFQTLTAAGFSAVPKYWTVLPSAEQRGNSIILERHTVTGQSGAGIRVVREGEAFQQAPLYVEYIKKNAEYRVHVFNGKAIAVQQKRRDTNTEQSPDQKLIRNHQNGWVFCVEDVVPPENLEALAVEACSIIGADFAAVDMIVGRDGKCYVLELNSKPGLSSPTVLSAYANAVKELISDLS